MELVLIRHALPVRRELEQGPADPGLSDVGRDQAAYLGRYLAVEQVDAVYASPMRRALETAEIVAAELELPVVIDEGVAEWDRTSSAYVPIEELRATNDPRWQQMLDGSWQADLAVDPFAFRDQVVEAVEGIVAVHPGDRVVVVCHGGVINAYLTRVLGIEDPRGFFYPNYTSLHRVVAARDGRRSILTLNETAHLRGTGLVTGLFG